MELCKSKLLQDSNQCLTDVHRLYEGNLQQIKYLSVIKIFRLKLLKILSEMAFHQDQVKFHMQTKDCCMLGKEQLEVSSF